MAVRRPPIQRRKRKAESPVLGGRRESALQAEKRMKQEQIEGEEHTHLVA